MDDETSAVLRDRVTTSYTTIALVSALLAGVSFLAYATPPSQIFSAAGGSAAAAACLKSACATCCKAKEGACSRHRVT